MSCSATRRRLLDPTEMRPVFLEVEAPVVAITVIELSEGEGEQRQGVGPLGVGHHRLDQAGAKLQAGDLGRPFDDLGSVLRRQRSDNECLETEIEQRRVLLKDTEEVRAHRAQYEQRRFRGLDRCPDQPQEPRRRMRLRPAEQLFELVNDEEDPRLCGALGQPQLLAHLDQRVRRRRLGEPQRLMDAIGDALR